MISAGAVWSRGSAAGRLDSFLDNSKHSEDPWEELGRILARIKPPAFPNRDFEVSDYGAEGDNQTDCTEAFSKAIAACHASGGGRVVVPPGQYITGAIALKSNVNLYLSQGATIRFSRESKKYPLVFTRWEGTELMNYSPFSSMLSSRENIPLPARAPSTAIAIANIGGRGGAVATVAGRWET